MSRKKRKYFSINSDDPIWSELSHELRGKDFRVPYTWREGGLLGFNDWKLLIKKNLVGKAVHIQKVKRINYSDILNPNSKSKIGL